MKLFVVFIIAVIIFALVYLSSEGNTEKAAICAALAAAIAFAGPYIVNLGETREPGAAPAKESGAADTQEPGTADAQEPGAADTQEPGAADTRKDNDKHDDDSSTHSGSQTSSDREDLPVQFVRSEPSTPDSELSIDKIAAVKMEIETIEPKTMENAGAQIDVYHGSLSMEGQVDTYLFTPNITGRYRFEISGLTSGTDHAVNLVIKNSGDGVVGSTSYGIANGNGLTIQNMQAGETFRVQVKQYTGLDSYTLSIGSQKKAVDATGYTVVKDRMEFKDQRNIYLFTPPITGKYRFEISDLTKGSDHEVNLVVYNSGGGEEASTSYGTGNGGGLTIAGMQAGQTYEVHVCQYTGVDSYNLNIGYQKDSVDITDYNVVADSIQYCDQKNRYFFTPAVTGCYRFELSNLTKGSSNEVNLSVWNSRGGEEGSTTYGIGNGDGLTIKDMQAGETYEIQVCQYSGYDMYNLNIGLQKETADISEVRSVSDSIQYTDQRNVYTFTPSSTGKYRFEIQGLTDGTENEVNVLVFNSGGGEEGSTSYGIANGGGLEIANLQAGETYQVQVRYYSGYDFYKLITAKVSE